MYKWIIGIVIEKIIKVVAKAITDYFEARKAKKVAKEKIKEIMSDTEDSPKERQRRLDTYLNSGL